MEKKSSRGLFNVIKSVIYLIDRDSWYHIIPLLILMGISAVFNAVGVTMVVPFVTVAANPELIQKSHAIYITYQYFHFKNHYQFLIFLGTVAFTLLVVGNILNIMVAWLSAKVSYTLKYKWLNHLFSEYLHQPYIFFLNNRVSDLSKKLLQSVSKLGEGVVAQLFEVFSKGFSITAILLVLILVNPLPAVTIMLCIGVIYFFIFKSIKGTLKRTNHSLQFAAQQTFKIIEESFYTIKEVKLYQKEKVFLQQFEVPTRNEKRYVALAHGLAPSPRYILEIFAFGGVILLVLSLLMSHRDLSNLLPIMGFFVIALYRLMPLTQSVFAAISHVLMNAHAAEEIVHDYKHLAKTEVYPASEITDPNIVNKLSIFQRLTLNNIQFKYPGAAKNAVANLNLNIMAGQVIGFVGPSGAGKSSIIDIILGLLKPDQGEMCINGERINTLQTCRTWQRLLGYVPQAIVLTNATIAENIAFGVPLDQINMEKVEKAAQFAQLNAFIQMLPEGYATHVGDRGVRLSGGQRQRIGIARALYHEPQVLVFDEATNALDGVTEMEIMQSVHALAGHKTIIIIAHRLQTIRACDRVYYIDEGCLVAEGTYNHLAETHAGFRKMVKLAEGDFVMQEKSIIETVNAEV